MDPERLEIVSESYGSEIEKMFQAAEKQGMVDPDFTAEKRAAYREIEKLAGMEGLSLLDEIAFAQLDGFQKIALYGGLGRLLSKEAGWFDALMRGAGKTVGGILRGGGGAALGAAERAGAGAAAGAATGAAAGAVERAGAGAATKAIAAPSEGFMQAFSRRGAGADAAKGVWNQFNQMGPQAYSRMRRVMGRPVANAVGGAAQAAAPAAAGAAKRFGWGDAGKELRSGLLFGGAFGLGGRLMGGNNDDNTKVQVGY